MLCWLARLGEVCFGAFTKHELYGEIEKVMYVACKVATRPRKSFEVSV